MPPKKKKEAEKPVATTKIEKFTRDLRVPLKAEEIAERADRAAQLLQDRDNKEAEAKAQAKHLKSVIEEVEAELRRVSNEVRTKATYQPIHCERHFIFADSKVRELRADTGEVIGERDMTDAEKQQEFTWDKTPGNVDDEFSGDADTGTEGE